VCTINRPAKSDVRQSCVVLAVLRLFLGCRRDANMIRLGFTATGQNLLPAKYRVPVSASVGWRPLFRRCFIILNGAFLTWERETIVLTNKCYFQGRRLGTLVTERRCAICCTGQCKCLLGMAPDRFVHVDSQDVYIHR